MVTCLGGLVCGGDMYGFEFLDNFFNSTAFQWVAVAPGGGKGGGGLEQ